MTETVENPVYRLWARTVLTGDSGQDQMDVAALWADRPEAAEDAIGYLWFLVDAWCDASTPCPRLPEHDVIITWLTSPSLQAARATNSYLEARAQDIARLLGTAIAPQDPPTGLPTEIGQTADLFSVFGYAWLSTHGFAATDLQGQARDLIAPLLDTSPDGHEMEAYLVSQAWVWLGGSPGALAPMANELRTRIDDDPQSCSLEATRIAIYSGATWNPGNHRWTL